MVEIMRVEIYQLHQIHYGMLYHI